MKNSIKAIFYMRRPLQMAIRPSLIYLRITVAGKRAEVSTGRTCDFAKWNALSQRVAGTKEEIRSTNAFLDQLRFKVMEAHRALMFNEQEVNPQSLKQILQGIETPKHMLLMIFKEHNRKMAAQIGREFALGTSKRYETSLKHTYDFIKSRYKSEDIPLSKVDHHFISEYDYYLRTDRSCANNSAVKYMKNLSKILTICLDNGWMQKNPLSLYKGKVKTVDRIFLSESELVSLLKKSFSSERLCLVRDIFVFSCYTGLAYADVQKLTSEEIQSGVDGLPWIMTHRKKTNGRACIPLLPPALSIISKYETNERCRLTGKILPVPTNQKVNEYLKEIASICHINKELTFHTARHTFATTVTLSNGVPIESVSKMMGHASIKQTQHYAKILDTKVSQDMLTLQLQGKFNVHVND